MEMTAKQTNAMTALEKLVTKRFTKKSLTQTLSKIFDEEIRLIKVSNDELVGDYEFTIGVNNDKSELYGFGTIYYLPMRKGNETGDTIYVTEVYYEFEWVK
jgi:hypothetical protein